MLQTRVRKALFSFAVAGAAALGAAGPAQAITVGATWDPYYGSPFVSETDPTQDMWWSGKGDIFIPNECGVPTGTVELTCEGMEVRNAFIYLREGENAATPFATLNFSANTVQINKASFVGGQLVGVDSNYFDPWQSTAATLFGVDKYQFTFGFTYDGARLYHADEDGFEKHEETGHDDPDRFWKGVGKGHLIEFCPDAEDINKSTTACGFSQEVATVQFAVIAVPEPQTYALMLAGLAVLGFVARRRRQT